MLTQFVDRKDTEYSLPSEPTEQQDQPSYVNAAYARMRPMWDVVNDVYEGTLRMREKKEIYLPKFALESDNKYEARCLVVTLMNAYARTVDAMVGLVVGSGIKLKNLPAKLQKHIKNIDNAGTEFEVFAREGLRKAFVGHHAILIDMPAASEVVMPGNAVEARKSDLRPYWIHKPAETIYNWRTEIHNGKTVLSQITFREDVTIPNGQFGEAVETQFMRWYIRTDEETGKRVVSWARYREETHGKGKKQVRIYVKIGGDDTHLSRIPVVVIYGDQHEGRVLESKPPLLDLALKNIEHMQIDSDYKKGLSVAGLAVPTLKSKRDDDEIKKIFGWDQLMVIDEDEDFSFVEANGQALPNKRTALEDIKREMGVLGLSLIAERADANITATERLLDSVQQSNQLMAIQASFIMAMHQAFEIHAEWMKETLPSGEEDAFEVALGLDWTEIVRSADHMQVLLEMAKEDFLSTATFLEAAAKYGVLPSYIDPIEEVKRLKAENRVRVSRFEMKSTTTGPQLVDKATGASQTPGKVVGPKATAKADRDPMKQRTKLNASDRTKET